MVAIATTLRITWNRESRQYLVAHATKMNYNGLRKGGVQDV